MKKLTDWLFGAVKKSPVIQGLLGGAVFAYFIVLTFWLMAWLVSLLPWPKG